MYIVLIRPRASGASAEDDRLVGDHGRLRAEIDQEHADHEPGSVGQQANSTNDRATRPIDSADHAVRSAACRRTRPARGAARMPATPTTPNSPAVVDPRWNGAPCSNSASTDQNALIVREHAGLDQRRAPQRAIPPSQAEQRQQQRTRRSAHGRRAARQDQPQHHRHRRWRSPRRASTSPAIPHIPRPRRDSTRASRTPLSRPLITVPTTRPRAAGSARSAANGMICCAVAPPAPTSADATTSADRFGAIAPAAKAITVATSCQTISRTPVDPVAQRNEQEDAEREAELGRGRHRRDRLLADAEIARHRAEHRLVVPDVRSRRRPRRSPSPG